MYFLRLLLAGVRAVTAAAVAAAARQWRGLPPGYVQPV